MTPGHVARAAAIAFALAAMLYIGTASAVVQTRRVSVDSTGTQTTAPSGSLEYPPAISADGTYIAFESPARTLVAGDTNGVTDVFLRDTQHNSTERLSVSSAGEQANGRSYGPSISADGRFIAFEALASNLAPGDANGLPDVYLRDRQEGTTVRVSAGNGGADGGGASYRPAISPDGGTVVFCSKAPNLVAGDTNGATDVFAYNRSGGAITRINLRPDASQSEGGCSRVAVSDGARFIAYSSAASDLVSGDDNGRSDVFLYQSDGGKTVRASVGTGGGDGNDNSGALAVSVSDDGRYVTFDSPATDLVDGDNNGVRDVFLRDVPSGATRRVSAPAGGAEGNGASGGSSAAISRDGRYVVFDSRASNLVPDDGNGTGDVFRYDVQPQTMAMVSVGADGKAGNDFSYSAAPTADGAGVAYVSAASNIVFADQNQQPDVFEAWGEFPASGNRPVVTTTATPAATPGGDIVVPEEGSGPSAALIAAIVVLALAGAGGAFWWFRLRQRPTG